MGETNITKKAGVKKTLKKKGSFANSISSSVTSGTSSIRLAPQKTDEAGLAAVVQKITSLTGRDWMEVSQHKRVKSNAASDYITLTATNVCSILSLPCNSWPATAANFSSSKKTLSLLEAYDPSLHSLAGLTQQHPPPYEVPKESCVRLFGHWVMCCINLQSKAPVPQLPPQPTPPVTKTNKTQKRKKALEKLVATMDDTITESPEAVEAAVARKEEEENKQSKEEILRLEAERDSAHQQLKQELDKQRNEQELLKAQLEERERSLQEKEEQIRILEQQHSENDKNATDNENNELQAKEEELLKREHQLASEKMSHSDRVKELERREQEAEQTLAELNARCKSSEAQEMELKRKQEELDKLEADQRAQQDADELKQRELAQREADLQSEMQKAEVLKDVEAELEKRQAKVVEMEHYLERKGIMGDVMIIRQQIREIQNEEVARLRIQQIEDFEVTQHIIDMSDDLHFTRLSEHKATDPPPTEQEVDEKVNAVLSERRKRDQRKSLEYGLALARQSQDGVFSERGSSLSPTAALHGDPRRSQSPRFIHSPQREDYSASPSGYAPVTPPVTKYASQSMSQTPPLTLPRLGGRDRVICTSTLSPMQHSYSQSPVVHTYNVKQPSPETIDRDRETELPQTEFAADLILDDTNNNDPNKIIQFKKLALQQHHCINECYAFLNSPLHNQSWSYSDPTPSPDHSLEVPRLQGVFNAPQVSQIATLHSIYEGDRETEETSLKTIVREQHKHLVALAARCEEAGMLPSDDCHQLLGSDLLSSATSPRVDTSA